MSTRWLAAICIWAVGLAGCQVYEFVFEPDQIRQGVSLRFEVATPARADILFVVDNSESMREQQATLAKSFDAMLEVLAPADNSYRIGLISTDAHGFQASCCGNLNPLVEAGASLSVLGARGNCERCDCNGNAACSECDLCVEQVELNRPHDGTRGRLMAAYDPQVMGEALTRTDLSELARNAMAVMLPSGPGGMPSYIDRDTVSLAACEACGCADCAERPVCSQEALDCVDEAGSAAVRALFRSNLSGLGVHGFGWEEGLKAALWAVGIDPEEPLDANALAPGYDLLRPGSPNAALTSSAEDGADEAGWTRDDAVLAILFVTDEDDCSAPSYLMERRHDYEVGPWPVGSFCYMGEVRESLLGVERMASLLTQSRGGSQSRLVVGVIGGLEQSGEGQTTWADGRAAQCRSDEQTGEPEFECACLAGAGEDEWESWCELTGGIASDSNACHALSGSRYTEFASGFRRGVYESICRGQAAGGFVDALERFSALVTESCFELDTITPAGRDPANVRVSRLPRERSDDAAAMVQLQQVDGAGTAAGWYYDAAENKVCLSLIERRIGDHYEIFVYHEDVVDYRQ